MKTIEEKAKAYDEAMKQAIEIYDASNEDGKLALEMIFPELAESEDERIRIAIINLVNTEFGDRFPFDGFTREQMLAWLERQGEHTNFRNKIQVGDKMTRNEDGVLVNLSQLKRVAKTPVESKRQGEQKPVEWSEEEEEIRNKLIDVFEGIVTKGLTANLTFGQIQEFIGWLKSLKDRVVPQTKQEWSEEDEQMICSIIFFLAGFMGNDDKIGWLNTLKDRVVPQKKQGWSKEDIEMIEWLIRCCEKEHEELCNDRYGHQDIVSDLKRDCRKKWDWLESLKSRLSKDKE